MVCVVAPDTNDLAAGDHGSEQSHRVARHPPAGELHPLVDGVPDDLRDDVSVLFQHSICRVLPGAKPHDPHGQSLGLAGNGQWRGSAGTVGQCARID